MILKQTSGTDKPDLPIITELDDVSWCVQLFSFSEPNLNLSNCHILLFGQSLKNSLVVKNIYISLTITSIIIIIIGIIIIIIVIIVVILMIISVYDSSYFDAV